MKIIEEISEVIISFVKKNGITVLFPERPIAVDGKTYFFIDNNYDNDYALLESSISTDIHPGGVNRIEFKKSYYLLIDANSYSSIGLISTDTVEEAKGFTKEFFATKFTLNKETREITVK
jgi:hypothetical protein